MRTGEAAGASGVGVATGEDDDGDEEEGAGLEVVGLLERAVQEEGVKVSGRTTG